jgi:hypothetical protein
LSQTRRDADAIRRRVPGPGWYGGGERAADRGSGAAVRRHAGPPVVPIRRVLARDPPGRFNPQAWRADPHQHPHQVRRRFVQPRRAETAFQETRTHPGVETRRRWSDRAIARAARCLRALVSLLAPLAAQLSPKARELVMSAARYRKPRPTLSDISDTLAAMRRHVGRQPGFALSRPPGEATKLRSALREGMTHALRHPA